MTTAPLETAIGANFSDTLPPALKKARSIPSKEFSVNSSMMRGCPLNTMLFPAERLDANNFNEVTGIG